MVLTHRLVLFGYQRGKKCVTSVLKSKRMPGRYFLDLIISEKCITPLRRAITYGLDS